VRPEGWDDDEDGEWSPPMIANPLCKPPGGCGTWTQKTMKNPDYKGVWAPKKIKNPEYKGAWTARPIPNPDFFEDRTPADVPSFDSIGFELWTMQSGIIFDNIVIAKNAGDAFAYATATWKARRAIEDEWSAPPKRQGTDYLKEVQRWLHDMQLDGWNGLLVVGLLVFIAVTAYSNFGGEKKTPEAENKESPKTADAAGDKKETEEQEKEKEISKAEDESKGAQSAEQTELRNRNKAAGLNLNED
jgi:calnexin